MHQNQTEHNGNHDLERHLLLHGKTVAASFLHLQKIIDKTDKPEAKCQKQHRKNLRIPYGKNKTRNQESCQNHKTAHIRRSGFGQMALRSVIALRLLRFHSDQCRNQKLSGDCRNCKCNQHRYCDIHKHSMTHFPASLFCSFCFFRFIVCTVVIRICGCSRLHGSFSGPDVLRQ